MAIACLAWSAGLMIHGAGSLDHDENMPGQQLNVFILGNERS
jgi:hypothetical protein